MQNRYKNSKHHCQHTLLACVAHVSHEECRGILPALRSWNSSGMIASNISGICVTAQQKQSRNARLKMQSPAWDAQINLAMYRENGVPLGRVLQNCSHTRHTHYSNGEEELGQPSGAVYSLVHQRLRFSVLLQKCSCF